MTDDYRWVNVMKMFVKSTTHTRIYWTDLLRLRSVADNEDTTVARLLRDLVALANIYDPRFRFEDGGKR